MYKVQYWSKVYDIGRFRGPHLKLSLLPFTQILIKFNEIFSKHKLKCILLNAFFIIELLIFENVQAGARMSYTSGHFVPFYVGQKYMTSSFVRDTQKNEIDRTFFLEHGFN